MSMRIVDEQLLHSFRTKGRCERCHRPNPGGFTIPHHVFCRGIGGGTRIDHPYNLIALCHECHQAFHDGRIDREDVVTIVADRERVDPGVIYDTIYFLRRASRIETRPAEGPSRAGEDATGGVGEGTPRSEFPGQTQGEGG